MIKFREKSRTNSTTDKIIAKYLGRGGNMHNKIAQKLLSIGVSASLMLAMVPNNGAFATEPTTFVASAKANHWGRSDLRSYMNGEAKDGSGSLPLDTTGHGQQESGYYESQFSDAEYGLVKDFTYNTNIFNGSADAVISTYETTDKFWLPSGNVSNGKDRIISWGGDDISANGQYSQSTTNDKDRIIPISYWSYSNLPYSRLRSPYYSYDDNVLGAHRGNSVDFNSVDITYPSQAAACKIHLTSVIFASAASAASIAAAGTYGAKKIAISGSSDFGNKTKNSLPDYGMYLKTDSGSSFSLTDLSLSGTNLTVTYSGGVADQYVVVHAFKEDSFENGTTSFVAAQKLAAGGTSATIDVSAWDLSSSSDLDGYTIKVWMEDGSGSLAAATTPATFYGTSSGISNTGTEIKNARVFAMKDDLQTSWGDLSALSEEDYNNVISGNPTSENSGVMGENPTNQKIYFGEKDGQPLEFWIAGRETAANGGNISASGDIMTLYQAKSVETKQFNASTNNYDVSGKSAVTLQLQDNQSVEYSGSAVKYPGLITFTQDNSSLETSGLPWQHRMPGSTSWTDDMPTNPGNYEIRCYAEGTENYERTYSAIVNFKVIGNPSAGDFIFNKPSYLTYDGQPKTVTVKPKTGVTGMGTVTVKYYQEDGFTPAVGTDATTAPTNAGTYTVKIDVAEGSNYTSATVESDDWKFIIGKAEPSYLARSGVTVNTIYGQSLDDLTCPNTALGAPTFVQNGTSVPLGGNWAWVPNSLSNDTVGIQNAWAKFVPTDTNNNFDWNNVNITGDGSSAKIENGVLMAKVTVNIQALPMKVDTIVLSPNEFIYNGTDRKPEIKVKNNGTELTDGTDYEIDWPSSDYKNAGTKDIKIKFKGNYASDSNGDDVADNPNNGIKVSYEIKKAGLTPEITAENKYYDGKNDATVSVTFKDSNNNEVALGKDMDYTVSAAFNDKNVGTGKTVEGTISLKNTNYTFKNIDGEPTNTMNFKFDNAEIQRSKITVTANNQTKMEGEADPELTYTAEGLIGTEKLEGQLERAPGSEVGTYEITQGTLTTENNPNYDITFVPGTFTITENSVPVEPENPSDKPTPDEPENPSEEPEDAHPDWGDQEIHAGIKHYVNAEGMTSVEVTENGIIWLREESYDPNLGRNTAAWYGLDNTSGIFKKGSRFYVQWLNEREHPDAFENIDEETRAEIDSNRGWLFKIGVIAPDGTRYEKLSEEVDLYVQIGDDWDSDDLEGFYITLENDESVPVRYGTTTYPEGTDEFGIMSLSHFSPYFIYDKLTDEEKAQLDAAAKELSAQQEEASTEKSAKTGDEITYFTVSGLGLIMTLALGLMLKTKINKKKFDK